MIYLYLKIKIIEEKKVVNIANSLAMNTKCCSINTQIDNKAVPLSKFLSCNHVNGVSSSSFTLAVVTFFERLRLSISNVSLETKTIFVLPLDCPFV